MWLSIIPQDFWCIYAIINLSVSFHWPGLEFPASVAKTSLLKRVHVEVLRRRVQVNANPCWVGLQTARECFSHGYIILPSRMDPGQRFYGYEKHSCGGRTRFSCCELCLTAESARPCFTPYDRGMFVCLVRTAERWCTVRGPFTSSWMNAIAF